MNNKLLILILIVLGLLGFYFLKNSMQNTADDAADSTMMADDEEETDGMEENMDFSGKLTTLLGLGKNLKCDFSYDGTDSTVEGMSYVSGDKMRSDITTTDKETGAVVDASVVSDGEYMYSWSSESDQGVKFAIPDEESMANTTENSVEEDTESDTSDLLDDNYDYSCSAWIPNNNMFETPEGMEFTDFSAMMESFTNPESDGTEDAGSIQCMACNYMTGDEKTSCLETYSCN